MSKTLGFLLVMLALSPLLKLSLLVIERSINDLELQIYLVT